MIQLSRKELQACRIRLEDADTTDLSAVVARLTAIQAQEKPSAFLAFRPRTRSVTASALEHALYQKRIIVRLWCLRGTLHLVAAADVRWMLDLVAPRQLKNSQRRYRELELDEDTLSSATDHIVEALDTHGALTRSQIADYLTDKGISTKGQRLYHLLRRAGLLGLICFGPDRDGDDSFVLADDWLPGDTSPGMEGWVTLARRYLGGYGPASLEDFVRWSGATKKDARTAFDALDLDEVKAADSVLWMLAGDSPRTSFPKPAVHLLPAYDPLLLGYRSRDWLVKPEFARAVHPGGGFIRPTMIVNGEAAGTWKHIHGDGRTVVSVSPFTPLEPDVHHMLEAERADIGRFHDTRAELQIGPALA